MHDVALSHCYEISTSVESSAGCYTELFLTNYSTRSLPTFRRSSVTPRPCIADDTGVQFCVVEVTAATFTAIVLDPAKVTVVFTQK